MTLLECVGRLYRWDPLTKQATDPHAIPASQPLVVGRNRKKCQYVFDDACVSNQHLRIYTVVYDLENPLNIPPLVYAQDLSMNGTFWNGQRIDRSNGGAVLLSDGDILRLSSNSFLEFRSEYQSDKPLHHIQQKEIKTFQNEYLITDRILGEGGFGQVRMAVNLNKTSQVACKIVNFHAVKDIATRRKDDHGTGLLVLQKREVTILQMLCHPNIIGIEKVFMMESSLYIFEDLITAGDLFTFVESRDGSITDFEAASVVQQILIAVKYLHDNNIVHRDIKPENILLTSHEVKRRVVLADFGCAQIVAPGCKRMSTVIGTWDYTAPEVYKETKAGYTKSVDLWSVGCVAVVLLMGTPPFPFSASETFKYIEPSDLDEMIMDTRLNEASAIAQDFILSLLVMDERKRLTAKQALQHSWFLNEQYQSKLKRLYDEAVQDWYSRNGIDPPKSDDHLQSIHRGSHNALRTAPTLQLSKNRADPSRAEIRAVTEADKHIDTAGIISSSCSRNRNERATRDKICVSQSSMSFSETRRFFSPQAWKRVPERTFASSTSKPDLHQTSPKVGGPQRSKANLGPAHKSGVYTSSKLNGRAYMPTEVPAMTIRGLAGVKRGFDETLSQSPEVGEIYEEIENRITGKVQRFPYEEK